MSIRRASWRSVRENVKPADVDDVLVLGVALLFEMLEDALVIGLRHAIERVEVIEIDELLVLDEALLALREPLGNLFRQALLARHELGVAAKQDVRAAAGHVGGNRDRTLAAGLRDELGLLSVILRVQHDVLVGATAGRGAALEASFVEHRRQPLRLLDRHGADKNRPALRVLVDDFGDDRVPFLRFGPIDQIRVFDALQLPVGRDDDDVEVVDLGELLGFRVGGAGHARQLLVLAEVILERDGRESLVLPLDLHFWVAPVVLLGLHGLVQTIAPSPTRHQPAGEFVDDDDFAVFDHVVHVVVVTACARAAPDRRDA